MALEDGEAITRIFGSKKRPAILGDEDSVSRIKSQFFEERIHPQASDSRALAPGTSQIMQTVCSYYGLDETQLLKSRRGRFNEPRAVAVYLVCMMRTDSFLEIASAFGLRGYSSVGGILEMTKKQLASDPELNARCRHIRDTVSTGYQET